MKYFVITLSALILGYSNFWIGAYVSLFQPIQNHGTLNTFVKDCKKTSATSFCSNKYIVPWRLIQDAEYLGTGMILSATKYYCSNENSGKKYYDDIDSPGKQFDLMNTYQIVNLRNINCGGDLIIEAWSRKGAIRKGFQEGALTTGDYNAVNRVKTLTEFFNKEIHRIFCFLFIMVTMSFGLIGKILRKDIYKNPFTPFITFWLIFIFTASDVFQTLFPYTGTPQLFNKIVAISSILAHSLPVLREFISKTFKNFATHKDQKKLTGFTIILVTALCFSPLWLSTFHAAFLTTFLLSLYLGLRYRSFLFVSYSLVIILVELKIRNYSFTPSAMTTSTFLGLLLCTDLFIQLKAVARLATNVLNVKLFSTHKQDGSTTKEIEQSLLEVIPAKKVSFLTIKTNGECSIKIWEEKHGKRNLSQIEFEHIPPVFAYAIANDVPLVHEPHNTDLLKQIKSKEGSFQQYEGEYLSVYPLKHNGTVHAAIAFTDYPSKLVSNESKNEEIQLYLDTLTPIYCEKLIREKITKDHHWQKRLNNLKMNIDLILRDYSQQKKETIPSFFGRLQIELNNTLNSHGYFAELDKESRQANVLACEGYPDEIANRIQTGKIYAHEENRHGPIPLAIYGRKPIPVGDVSLLKGVLHEFTNYFFKVCETKSCLALPIITEDNSKLPWGVMFFESKDKNAFTTNEITFYKEISFLIAESISRKTEIDIHNQTHERLKSFVPEENVQDVLSGEDFEIDDRGYLLMIDLKNSTKIANRLGRTRWEVTANEIKNQIKELTNHNAIILQDFKWDAFYFTISKQNQEPQDIEIIKTFLSDCTHIINLAYQKGFPEYPEYQNPNTPKGRYCLVYGDTSRGLVGATTKTWTFKGEEMANVTKLEDTCKSIQKENPYSILFCDSSIHFFDKNWSDTQISVTSNNRNVYASIFSWSDILELRCKPKDEAA